MTRDEAIALFLRGRDAWNLWAEKLAADRSTLVKVGRWSVEKNPWGVPEPQNDKTFAWMEAAKVDLSHCRFVAKGAETPEATENAGAAMQALHSDANAAPVEVTVVPLESECIDFAGFKFPGDTSFEHSTFAGDAKFRGAVFTGSTAFGRAIFAGTAKFDGATFANDAEFRGASFAGDVNFRHANFAADAGFGCTTFAGNADFVRANFTGNAWFGSATFAGDALFEGANLTSIAWFEGASFARDADFWHAKFLGDAWLGSTTFAGDVKFESAVFQKATLFRKAKFQRAANFAGIKADRAFIMTDAAFSFVPAFNHADFSQAPDLDDVYFPLPALWHRGNAGLIPSYRALRRMAALGADHEREQMAFKGELRSKRWTDDKFWHPGFWIGLFYDTIADCGQSTFRPFLLWLLSVLIFSAYYLQAGTVGLVQRCGTKEAPVTQALYLSVKNAVVLLGGTRDARAMQAYYCLYDGVPGQPQIPAHVTFVETLLQLPLSAVLLFLIMLAVRNRYRVK